MKHTHVLLSAAAALSLAACAQHAVICNSNISGDLSSATHELDEIAQQKSTTAVDPALTRTLNKWLGIDEPGDGTISDEVRRWFGPAADGDDSGA